MAYAMTPVSEKAKERTIRQLKNSRRLKKNACEHLQKFQKALGACHNRGDQPAKWLRGLTDTCYQTRPVPDPHVEGENRCAQAVL